MQHLIRTLTDSTGHTFTHITQARENETFTVVEAGSKGEAKRKYNERKDSERMKRIFKTLLIIALYELSKVITYEVIVKKQANDMVEQPGYDEIDSWKKY
ncbi:transcriptional activator RinB [Staphylococcus sp. KG4-3]|uniref:transcriptional activator RinB n=1 Tax=Staphylococcus sp. KG4-3 TaxID=3093634 RepID=UPI00298EE6D6|nr:DUF1381 domain-containing protein [Staphylococcus sp. KG4-3]MDW8544409.1 DUF1381 domain-containing protein [Staphylococcus sp. KG4-1]MDW8560833.1 DUF1381 domain-containing protein [Staphylococcus sp. KG4-3]